MNPVTYNPAAWSSFFSAQVSAAAALTGLIFVALSINISQVLASQMLIMRTAKALVSIGWVLMASILCLIPAQRAYTLGWELTILGTLAMMAATAFDRVTLKNNPYITRRRRVFFRLLTHTSSLPFLLCGISLLRQRGGGLYWMVPATMASLVVALLDAWVLMIEIRR